MRGGHLAWQQLRQNSVAALIHGISHFDGVEMDLRLSSDGVLVLRHDNTTPDGEYVELLDSGQLASCADNFEELINDSDFTRPWQEKGKTVCIELKSPHPSSGVAGGWRGGKERVSHISRMIRILEDNLADFDLPAGTTVIYSFDPNFLRAAKRGGCSYPRARLTPNLREWGAGKIQKAIATPSFIGHSLPRLMRKHQRWGAPMIPCAIEYLTSYTRHLPLGSTVSLRGRGLARLTKTRKGFPAFVWPVKLADERAILDAGLTAITDDCSPKVTHLPDGSPRRPLPATVQMVEGVEKPWFSLSDSERKDVLWEMKNRWNWSRSIDQLMASSASNQVPWEVPRLIGHRGTGKTSHLGILK